MSTNNICFHGEITKTLSGWGLFSGAVQLNLTLNAPITTAADDILIFTIHMKCRLIFYEK